MIWYDKLDKVNILRIDSERDLDRAFYDVEKSKANGPLTLKVELNEWKPETYAKLTALSLAAKEKGWDTSLVISAKDKDFTASELEPFIEVEDSLNKNGVGLYFAETNYYSLSEVIDANLKLNEVIDGINATKASPFEKYLMVYNYLTSFAYKENDKNKSNSRDIIALLNSDDIVCVGYSKLMKRICDGVGIPCYSQSVSVVNSYGSFGHRNNIVYIKDDKYGIDGCYYCDSCWDSVKKEFGGKKVYNHCLIPTSDHKMFKGGSVVTESGDDRFYKDISKEDLEFRKGYDMWYDEVGLQDECDKLEKASESLFTDKNRMTVACQKLKEVFKQANIPADLYSGSIYVPMHVDFNYLLSLLIDDNPDNEKLNLCVGDIVRAMEEKEMVLDSDDAYIGVVDDIYQKLDEVASGKYDLNHKVADEAKNDFFAINAETLIFMEIQEQKAGCEWDGDRVPHIWSGVKQYYDNHKKAEQFKPAIDAASKRGEPIALDAFRKALKNALVMQGYDESTAEYEVEGSLAKTQERAEEIFEEQALNCFRAAAIEKRKSLN